ncbi:MULTISPECIES: sigma-54 interaction domain-containing protein [unclassified Clostridioides]|uniref:sigma-54 interaction domain-containing protein n=1 Tax=unclassified Clostridioides TaxID=2635829 RepID=UPI0006BBE60E|nr:ATPase AAA [Clostridioides difficile]MCC0691226.1 sigma 54-interacting transcriptional regulator [Clostridioides sp. ZZV14-6387]MDB3085052.1 AAA family ATPase [Clostridioides difficile]MDI0265745.1 sigma 54-interacting transcriptional regulator [Clostridioides difficile]NJI80050.1 sigma 54-interacting transcriptional regulator [Clostridioides difficile]
MKQSIAIVTDKITKLSSFLEENIRLVLGNYIDINHYYLENLKDDDKIQGDFVLVMTDDRLNSMRKHLVQDSKIIVVRRTLKENEIYGLFSIPNGTEVLVVNDTKETTLETISLFYKIGVKNLKFTPYIEGKIYKDIDIAITPGVKERVPSYINKVIDLGNRYIDISTFIEIINGLRIDVKEIRKNLMAYSERLISLDNGVKDNYRQLFLKMEEQDVILNLSKDGIIFTSADGVINTFNKEALKILGINENPQSKNIEEVISKDLSILLEDKEIVDEVVFTNKKYINVNKKNIFSMGNKAGIYYNLQEITYIKKLEQNLTNKLREQGQIAKYTFKDIKTKNKNMIKCIELAKKISKSDLSVLIIGESGTGKELLAQSIHNTSNRSNQPFIAVNCAAVPDSLLESQLFGYEKGSFTGALKEGKKGLFELANNGTIFLDEIGDMPPLLQTKLLRVLQEKQVMPIGSHNVINIDVRIIAATNKNLPKMIREGKFREDLYYRLNVLPIDVPSLKNRKEDIITLMNFFLKHNIRLSPEVVTILEKYNWPGNIRELQNVASYVSLMCDSMVFKDDLPPYIKTDISNYEDGFGYTKKELEDILRVLYERRDSASGVGRGFIIEKLTEEGIEISENKVRKVLSYLSECGYISSKSGRCGSQLTPEGINLYNKMT